MDSTVCWQCSQPLSGEDLFCPHCQTLQQPSRDFYRSLGLPPHTLGLDLTQLQNRFYERSRQLHPDRFTRKPPREQQYSEDAMSILNDAYRTLRDPVQRAEYVLKENGFDIAEQRSKDVPAELLEEVFELNMALEEMRSGDDDARNQLQDARLRFESMQHQADTNLMESFKAYDGTRDRDHLARIRGILNRRRYIDNLIRDVEAGLG